MKKNFAALLLLCLFLASCGGNDEGEDSNTPSETVSGAKSGAFTIQALAEKASTWKTQRPSASVGLFSSMFLALGEFLPSSSAVDGVESQIKFIAGQQGATTDETFALIQEFGSVLQTDIVESLNRSSNREQTLNQYITILKETGVRMERRKKELEEQLDIQKKERVEQRKVVRDIQRQVDNGIRDKDYILAGSLQQSLAEAEGALAEIETQESLTESIIDHYDDLLEIGTERYNAMVKNRQLLISGLRVVDIPGVDDLDIIYKEPYKERKETPDTFQGHVEQEQEN